MEIDLTPDTTIGTGGTNPFYLALRFSQLKIFFGNKGPNRTGLNTFSTKNAIGFPEGKISLRHNLRSRTPVSEAYCVVDLKLVACLNTSTAKDTARKISYNERIRLLDFIWGITGGKTISLYLIFDRQILQTAITIGGTQILVLLGRHGLQLKIGPGIHIHILHKTIMLS
jgi:hypothetical protein